MGFRNLRKVWAFRELEAWKAEALCLNPGIDYSSKEPRFLSGPLTIRVPFLRLFGCNTGTQKEQGHKGTTGEPSLYKPYKPYKR